MAEKKTITPKQEKAILCLMEGLKLRAVAKKIGVGERTLARWLVDPVFCAERDATRQRVFDQAVFKLAGMADAAVEKLRAILTGKVKPDHGMLRAIEICLREARSTEEVGIRQMIAELKDEVSRRQA